MASNGIKNKLRIDSYIGNSGNIMIQFIRKHIFSGAEKNNLAPHILIVLCFYTVIVSVYTGLFFSTQTTIIRIIISACIIAAYILLERSPLKSEALAFMVPTILVALLLIGALLFNGDFLLFTYTTALGMVSLTYMKPKGLAAYILTISVAFMVVLLAFNINLLGASFTMVYNYLFFAVSVGLNVLVYVFCRSYNKALLALIEARNEAYQASLAKGTFLSNMSHEIRTPMNAIIGMTSIGKSARNIEQAHYALGKIEDASTHLLDIINDILDVSKIESGKFDLSIKEFRFDKMIQRVINVISFRVDEKKQSFIVHIDDKIPSELIGDDQRLAQVITNLLGNAVKFTPDGGVITFNATLLKIEDNLCTIQVEVTDTGIGMSPEQQAVLFQSFQQADSSIARKFGGTGLGLSIAKNLVEMMDGHIWVKSALGKGSTFGFTVQLKRVAPFEFDLSSDDMQWDDILLPSEDDGDAIEAPGGMAGGATPDYSDKCILLAEDIEINREIVISLLQPTNLKIVCAENGADAVRLYSETPDRFDMIFMDVQMPEMDGYDATRSIRALDAPKAKNIPIIAMTANVFREDIEKCLKAGMNGHVGKPLDIDIVLGILKKYLG